MGLNFTLMFVWRNCVGLNFTLLFVRWNCGGLNFTFSVCQVEFRGL